MKIGIDFDNTIICYDGLFHELARQEDLIPRTTPVDKTAVRDHLRSVDAEDEWPRLQGIVYGTRILGASCFPSVKEFFREAEEQGHELFIISHKTRYPYLGEKADLHKAALNWLLQGGFIESEEDLGRKVFFAPEKESKLERIRQCRCDLFIDDLPEFLNLPGFPEASRRYLFDPGDKHPGQFSGTRLKSWDDARRRILGIATA